MVWFVAAAVVVPALSAYAYPPEEKAGWRQGRQISEEEREARREKFHQQLGLTAEQEAQLTSGRKAHRAKMDELREALQAKRKDLADELAKPDLNTAQVNALKEEIKGLHNQQVDERVNSILAVRNILTPEQFAKFQQFGERFRERRHNKGPRGKEFGPGRGPGPDTE